jgi:hypothetical protein
VKRKKGCIGNNDIGNPMQLTSFNMKSSLVAARTGKAPRNVKAADDDAGSIPGEIDTE